MLLMKVAAIPTLAAGVFTQEFGEFVNIVSAAVGFKDPFISGTLVRASWSYTDNLLTVTLEKNNVPLGTPWDWAPCVTGDVASVSMLVNGE